MNEDLNNGENVKRSTFKIHFTYIILIMLICGFTALSLYIAIKKIKSQYQEISAITDKLKPFLDKEVRLKNMELTLLVNYHISKYEAKYYSIIYDDFAMQYNIPWEIYPTIVRVESNFNPTAKSDVGAIGLTQIMPETAKPISEKIGIKFDSKETLWNDIHNMVIGFTYLSEGIKENGLEHGVKRYLGGPGYSKKEKKKGDIYSYIGNYRTSIKEEFDRNQFIYMGVSSKIFKQCLDSSTLSNLPSNVDSLFINKSPLHLVAFKSDKKF